MRWFDLPTLDDVDQPGFGRALAATVATLLFRPSRAVEVGLDATKTVAQIGATTVGRAIGLRSAAPLHRRSGDRRFDDAAWSENAAFFAAEQGHLLLRRVVEELVSAAAVGEQTRRKTELALAVVVDALSPTNFLLTNPAALKRAFDTGGRSVVAGALNATHDVVYNRGRPRQVDLSSFTVGENLAATPGVVVFRNDLMEVIQYRPQTDAVHQIPLLICPPWINRFYVMDLAPGRSLVEWALRHGRTVFMISWANPDAALRFKTMDDYVLDGVCTALDVAADITGSSKVDLLGLCVGGLLAALTTAMLEGNSEERVGNLTLLNTMLDFRDPGDLGAFTDAASVDRLAKRMAGTGYLNGSDMAGTFDLLRANDLIFNYVSSGWLLGEPPAAMDILAWNSDSTRMPETMHLSYLRSCYGGNDLVEGRLQLSGQTILAQNIHSDVYVVAAVNDHIVPWRASFKTTKLVSGDVRFVLSSGGHIAGVVNPPSPKAWYVTGDVATEDPEVWRETGAKHVESWWADWARWGGERAGALVAPPELGCDEHPVLGEAPGRYVRGR